jgi:hypothetical protein
LPAPKDSFSYGQWLTDSAAHERESYSAPLA